MQATKHFGDRIKFYYERVPEERIDEFALSRIGDEDRSSRRVTKLFPELAAAREAYLGKEPTATSHKKQDVASVHKFSEVVEQLARQEEPAPARLHFEAVQASLKRGQKSERSRQQAL